ncbi:hypothetical protein BLL52_1370 [Rhodoferax antarcticus ANT.BR]|uniref:Uncharacterized protein n=1 Tax=Rhodoferax antarcticus ANT.BR TaxID=1111071 RepID=A0A1Q8YI14_9BURK|nr:hypothetical protein BLL52_1370 [Rhodoferax antarcticus ANT.BR]
MRESIVATGAALRGAELRQVKGRASRRPANAPQSAGYARKTWF